MSYDILTPVLSFFTDIYQQLQDPWKIFGLAAQGLFMMRFIVQWIASEKAGYSTLPIGFWYCSIAGALCLLVYGIRERELVIIIGQSFPLAVYIRNLWLIKRPSHKSSSPLL